jgi:uncharacterized membrane protein
MEGPILLASLLLLLLCVSFVVSIVCVARFGKLQAAVEELKRRVLELETAKEVRAPQPASPKPAVPPPLPAFLKPPPVPPAPKAPVPAPSSAINWESIFGVKLFAWVGGLALFLGVVFFVKYAFENNLITPLMRIVGGAVVGIFLVGISILPAVRRYRVPAQSVCATGLLILYADAYAAHSLYGLISLTATMLLMWLLTGLALLLATRLDAHSVAWLGVIGGFLTPVLLRAKYTSPVALFAYIGVLDCGIVLVGALKRWNYLVLLAAIGSVLIEFSWMAELFGPAPSPAARAIFLSLQALFLAICVVRDVTGAEENWSTGAAALTGFTTLIFCFVKFINPPGPGWQFLFPVLFLGNAGLIALAAIARSKQESQSMAAMIVIGLAFSWVAELAARGQMFETNRPIVAIAWYVALFLLFAGLPYFCSTERLWPWLVGAAAGPLQFWLVYQLMHLRFPHAVNALLPIAFALPAAAGVAYLMKAKRVDLGSADARLATQGAAVLAFVSLIFPVQFQREWITLGWAIEGVALILLYRWIPNPRLRAVALIVFCAAFVRLALNPAVLEYHPRTHVPIWNWYLYAYGLAALCFFSGAYWFGAPRAKVYERQAPFALYALGGIVLFLLMNIEIADYFSIGPTLTFSFHGDFARDMTYTIGWAVFAFGLLLIGMLRNAQAARIAAIALLCAALAKLFLHDLDNLSQLYRIGAFVTVAVIAIVASFVYQRFLSPSPRKS